MILWWCGMAYAQDWVHWPITIDAYQPDAVWVLDLDDDADNDVLYAASFRRVGWFETIGGAPTVHHIIADELYSQDLVPADLDADGDLDLVVAGYDGAVSVLWDEGPGWSAPVVIGAETGVLFAVRAVDLDGDADLDVVTVAADADLVVWYANDGAGGFGPSNPVLAVDDPYTVAAGDLDADGDADLVVGAEGNDGSLVWLANDGAGRFGAPAVVDPIPTRGAVAVDLDGDGDLDLAGASWDEGVRWYVNDGSGAFGDPIGLSDAQGADQRIVAGDVDGDGDQDLVSTIFPFDCDTPTDCTDGERLVVAYLNGPAGFTAETVIDRHGVGIGIGRIDRDGDPDLAVGDVHGGIRWYDRREDGWGLGEVLTSSVPLPLSVVASDLDGDGDLDVAATSRFSSRLSTYENHGAGAFGTQGVGAASVGIGPIFPADVDGDGDVDLLGCGEAAWFENTGGFEFVPRGPDEADATDVHGADLDGDGWVDRISAGSDGIGWQRNVGGDFGGWTRLGDGGTNGIATADVDGDGLIDVIEASSAQWTQVGWFRNFGGGAFGAERLVVEDGLFSDVAAADLDGDGDVDLAVTSVDGASWFANHGVGRFGPPIPLSTTATVLVAADFDLDGDVDLAIGDDEGDSDDVSGLTRYDNDGFGGFVPVQLAAPRGVTAVDAGDLDGDGDLDLITGASWTDSLDWLQNPLYALPAPTTTTPTDGDPDTAGSGADGEPSAGGCGCASSSSGPNPWGAGLVAAATIAV
ncbi:MAG: VCBS repeat-containing protein, partial [Myxococcota bacterium]